MLTDETLMQNYQLVEFDAFNQLYQRHHRRVFGFLRQRGLSREEAEEVFQNTFIKIHQKRLRYDVSYPFQAWLFTITRSALIDFIRKKQQIHKIAQHQNSNQAESVLTDELPHLALDTLSEQEQTIIKERYFQEKSYEEIAESLGLSAENIRQKLSRSLKKLKNILPLFK